MKVIDLNKKYKKNTRLDEIVTISCDDGDCYIESSSGVAGIQIKFDGKAEITPQLPEGWYLQGNNNTIVIFSLQNNLLTNQILFSYEGIMKIVNVIACNDKAERYTEKFVKSELSWGSSDWSMDVEADTWDNFKSNVKKGKATSTKYILPDYGLPKAEPTKKTKTKIKRRRSTGGY